MKPFFPPDRQVTAVTHGQATFELPVLYFRDDAFVVFYTADPGKIRDILPSDNLHPVLLPGRRSLVGLAAFNYTETTIGSYGEIGMIVPVVYGPKPPPVLLPVVLESRFPGFGALVLHLPVTKTLARDAGRGEWGYTKFIADMHFTITPEFMECCMMDGNHHILTMHVRRKGIILRDKKPLITYSVRNGDLIRTVIPQTGAYRQAITPPDTHVDFGDHPMADTFRALEPGSRPLLSRYYVERAAILPKGEVIESNVRPLDGYAGQNREGAHKISFLEATAEPAR
ncbi:MAG: acetoacetate decarboxylase family protein [Thermodesulfobacteriota bacterium]